MIGLRYRFPGHSSLRYVYTHGRVVRGPMLSLKYCLNPKRTEYRLAVVVSKKIMKSAVGRNRMRRRIYELVRLLAPAIQESYDLVITVYNEQIMNLPSKELSARVQAQLRQSHVVQNPGHDKIT